MIPESFIQEFQVEDKPDPTYSEHPLYDICMISIVLYFFLLFNYYQYYSLSLYIYIYTPVQTDTEIIDVN